MFLLFCFCVLVFIAANAGSFLDRKEQIKSFNRMNKREEERHYGSFKTRSPLFATRSGKKQVIDFLFWAIIALIVLVNWNKIVSVSFDFNAIVIIVVAFLGLLFFKANINSSYARDRAEDSTANKIESGLTKWFGKAPEDTKW